MEFPLKKIARVAGGKVIGNDSIIISGINSLDEAGPGDICFFADRRYKESLTKTKASAVIVPEKNDLFKGPQVVVSDPSLAYARVASLLAPPVPRYPGISERALVHEKSRIGKNVSIYPMVYIGKEAVIGDEVTLFPGVFVGDRVKIGKRTLIYANVSILQDCVIGNDVIIHAGTVIGGDGFGFAREGSVPVKIPQIGALGRTWIKRRVKTDNLVQVGHNVVIGENTVIVAQAGISGSVHVGSDVVIGGQVGIIDHLEIGDRAMIGSQSGVAKSVSPGEVVSGYPAMPHRLFLRTSGLIMRLPQLNDRLRHLERRLEELEKKLQKE
nr:UDP-3-O-(3-hydroxymyristoyl)glucosamine N-acyltransferase [Deltaproteobacteria bacterium]